MANDPTTALFRKLSPDHAAWPLESQLLAQAVNVLRDLRWMQTEDATKKPPKNRPDPILLPWETPLADPGKDTKSFGDARMSIDEAKEWLGW